MATADETDGRGPYAEALAFLDEGRLTEAVDRLNWVGRDLAPLAYDEAWAEVELARHDYGAAAGRAERTLRAGRKTARLHEIAAEALWRLGSREEARSHAELAGEGTARILFLRARLALNEGEYGTAEWLAARAHAMSPEWLDVECCLAAARALGGDRSGRVELRLLWERTRNPYALQLLLVEGARRKDPSVAEGLFLETLGAGALDGEILAQVMWARAERHDWDGVIAAFEVTPEDRRATAYCLRSRGHASVGKGDHEGSLSYLERAYAMEPTNEWTVDALFRALMSTGKWGRAIRLVREHSRLREAAGIRESSIREFVRNLRWRTRRRR